MKEAIELIQSGSNTSGAADEFLTWLKGVEATITPFKFQSDGAKVHSFYGTVHKALVEQLKVAGDQEGAKAIEDKLREEIMVKLIPEPPAWMASAGENLARKASVSVSSGENKAGHINDGDAAPVNNGHRWVSDGSLPHHVELTWAEPVQISAVRIVGGWNYGGRLKAPPEAFSLQYETNGQWKDVPGGKVASNRQIDWSGRFEPVVTKRLRLTVTKTVNGIARIWEWEAYNAPNPE